MYNKALDQLTDYPFDRLRLLLKDLEPPAGVEPMLMSLGEPQHTPPSLIKEIVASHSDEWGKYPPVAGSIDLLNAIKGWLIARYGLGSLELDVIDNIVSVSGTKEALFMAGDICIPRNKNGSRPAVLITNPFYQV